MRTIELEIERTIAAPIEEVFARLVRHRATLHDIAQLPRSHSSYVVGRIVAPSPGSSPPAAT